MAWKGVESKTVVAPETSGADSENADLSPGLGGLPLWAPVPTALKSGLSAL